MKTLLRLILVALSVAWAAAALAGPSYRLQVTGLACPFCAYGIEKKLSALEGVEYVETHIKDGAVIVTMHDGAKLNETAARKAVEAAGFTLDGFQPISTDKGRE